MQGYLVPGGVMSADFIGHENGRHIKLKVTTVGLWILRLQLHISTSK